MQVSDFMQPRASAFEVKRARNHLKAMLRDRETAAPDQVERLDQAIDMARRTASNRHQSRAARRNIARQMYRLISNKSIPFA